MGQNVEIKARIDSDKFAAVRNRAAELATTGPIQILQTDTFFECANGRLKLREFTDGSAELIAYERPNVSGPKTSNYVRSQCDGETMKSALDRSLGITGVVKKDREVFFVGPTRVHLDQVEGLGTFLELEVVLDRPEESPLSEEAGQIVAEELLEKLEIDKSNLLSSAYFDLLRAKHSTPN